MQNAELKCEKLYCYILTKCSFHKNPSKVGITDFGETLDPLISFEIVIIAQQFFKAPSMLDIHNSCHFIASTFKSQQT